MEWVHSIWHQIREGLYAYVYLKLRMLFFGFGCSMEGQAPRKNAPSARNVVFGKRCVQGPPFQTFDILLRVPCAKYAFLITFQLWSICKIVEQLCGFIFYSFKESQSLEDGESISPIILWYPTFMSILSCWLAGRGTWDCRGSERGSNEGVGTGWSKPPQADNWTKAGKSTQKETEASSYSSRSISSPTSWVL